MPKITNIPQQIWALADALNPYEIQLVGGSVRDYLHGQISPQTDYDMATPLPPAQVVALLAARGIRSIPTGLSHGTITALLDHPVATPPAMTQTPSPMCVEITTLRADIATNGRHATVSYTDDWYTDSCRRDFTMNALYLNRDGILTDYHNGQADLRAGVVRFIGQLSDRVQEDYLRILRYFRFAARYAQDLAAVHETAQAFSPHLYGLRQLSGERITQELARLLLQPNAPAVLDIMRTHAILEDVNMRLHPSTRLQAAVRLWPNLPPVARWYAAFGAAPQKKLVFSREHTKHLHLLAELEQTALDVHQIAIQHGQPIAQMWAALQNDPVAYDLVDDYTPPEFPLTGQDVLALGVPAGPQVGALLEATRTWWLRQHGASREACLQYLAGLQAHAHCAQEN